jgi:phosphatidylserine decarboxylase
MHTLLNVTKDLFMISSRKQRAHIENRLPVARDGLIFILLGLLISVILYYVGFMLAAILMVVVTLFIIYFFRDPARTCDVPDNALISPADGRIVIVRHPGEGDSPLGENTTKISIFMSIFDVHVNRVPTKGRISKIVYNNGKFFSANMDKASEHNENNRITLETDKGHRIIFIQIAGLIARRIVCWINEMDYVKSGQRFGLIRFGSRLDIYIPSESRIVIKVRDRVKAGETIIGYLP